MNHSSTTGGQGRTVTLPLWKNPMSIAGFFLATVSLLCILTFACLAALTPTTIRTEVLGHLVAPSILMFAVSLIPVGILFTKWRLCRRNSADALALRFPWFDLHEPNQRRVARFTAVGAGVLFPVMGVSGYHGYHYSDSVRFCGKACHVSMAPQATTYQHSAHARVPCAECHIGSGVTSFVKAKLNGTLELLATLTDTFHRPIVSSLARQKPASETCEKCHWAEKSSGQELRELVTFAPDEENTRRQVTMILNTGSAGDPTTGKAAGIHKHMAFREIKYVATDEEFQEIPWVEYVTVSGERVVYRSDGRPASDPPPQGHERVFDCLDCHNRPAHRFRSPQEAMDLYLDAGKIDTTLPFIKREAIGVLTPPYPDTETARAEISSSLLEFYRSNYPEVWETRRSAVDMAVDRITDIYEHNFFPDMNADWRTYPENIGHLTSPGCFRCHDGSHVNQYGESITSDCNTCHTFVHSVEQLANRATVEEGEFVHPYELQGVHGSLRCNDCHTGGSSPEPSCTGCHTDAAEFRAGTLASFERFDIESEPMADYVDCESCHDLSEPLHAVNTMCVDCHEDDGERFSGMLGSWKREVAGLFRVAETRADDEARRHLATLRRAGPFHNMEATRRILQAVITPGGELPQPDAPPRTHPVFPNTLCRIPPLAPSR